MGGTVWTGADWRREWVEVKKKLFQRDVPYPLEFPCGSEAAKVSSQHNFLCVVISGTG